MMIRAYIIIPIRNNQNKILINLFVGYFIKPFTIDIKEIKKNLSL